MFRIRLRALTIDDLPKTLEWHNNPEIEYLYSGHPFPVNIEMEKIWYEKILTSNYPTTVFGIEYIQEKALIGICVLKNINLINRNAEFAVYIGDHQYKGKGLSKEAVTMTLKFAFYKLNLHRIFLKVLTENIIAISLYKKIGFREEGLLIESVFKNNEFKNELVMGILNSEFNG